MSIENAEIDDDESDDTETAVEFKDENVSLVSMDRGHVIKITASSETEALDMNSCLEDTKYDVSNHVWSSAYQLSSDYKIKIEGFTLILQGSIEGLRAAAQRMHHCHSYISEAKMRELQKALDRILLPEMKAREREKRHAARKQEKPRTDGKNYLRKAIRNTVFARSSHASKSHAFSEKSDKNERQGP